MKVRLSVAEALVLLSVCLAPSFDVSRSAQAQEKRCWELTDVRADFQQSVDGGLEPLSETALDEVIFTLTTDDSPQLVAYDDPNYGGIVVFARVKWTPPPAIYCEGDVISTTTELTNLVPASADVKVASLLWRPFTSFARDPQCLPVGYPKTFLMADRERVQQDCTFQMFEGPWGLEAGPVWQAELHIGRLVASVHYYYREQGADIPMATPVSATVPLSPQQEALVLDIGFPDAFDIIEMDGADGAVQRYETWRYFQQNTAFVFIDGEFRFDAWEPYPPGGVWPVTLSPDQFRLGMSKQAVVGRFDSRMWMWVDVPGMSGLEFLASEQIVLGFEDDLLVYVEAIAVPREGDAQ